MTALYDFCLTDFLDSRSAVLIFSCFLLCFFTLRILDLPLQILPNGVSAHVERFRGAGEIPAVFLVHAADVQAHRIV